MIVQPAMVHRVLTTARVVAFTFDDGPHPVYTPQLLDIFRQVGRPELTRALRQDGAPDVHGTPAERHRERGHGWE